MHSRLSSLLRIGRSSLVPNNSPCTSAARLPAAATLRAPTQVPGRGNRRGMATKEEDSKEAGKQAHHAHHEKLIFAPVEDQYTLASLTPSSLAASPLTQFHQWFLYAQSSGISQPEASTLATAELPSGRVSARIVYMKELDDTGFVVYSNWGSSRKAKDIESNGNAALCFWWKELERQVRVEGPVERLTQEESQEYFDTRIRGSRIGAWASQQSTVLNGGREELEQRVRDVEKRFEGVEQVPVPPFWGGLRIRPLYVEFWQGRPSRLHDRFAYTRDNVEAEEWKLERLSP